MDGTTSTNPFVIGEKVNHHTAGVGQIIAIGEMEMSGFPGIYISVLIDTRTVVHVPLTNVGGQIRKMDQPLVQKDIVKILMSAPDKKRMLWVRKKRLWTDKLNSGDVSKWTEVIRDTAQRDSVSVSMTQRNIFLAACQRLINEFATTNGMEIADVVETFNRELKEVGILLEHTDRLINVAGDPVPVNPVRNLQEAGATRTKPAPHPSRWGGGRKPKNVKAPPPFVGKKVAPVVPGPVKSTPPPIVQVKRDPKPERVVKPALKEKISPPKPPPKEVAGRGIPLQAELRAAEEALRKSSELVESLRERLSQAEALTNLQTSQIRQLEDRLSRIKQVEQGDAKESGEHERQMNLLRLELAQAKTRSNVVLVALNEQIAQLMQEKRKLSMKLSYRDGVNKKLKQQLKEAVSPDDKLSAEMTEVREELKRAQVELSKTRRDEARRIKRIRKKISKTKDELLAFVMERTARVEELHELLSAAQAELRRLRS